MRTADCRRRPWLGGRLCGVEIRATRLRRSVVGEWLASGIPCRRRNVQSGVVQEGCGSLECQGAHG